MFFLQPIILHRSKNQCDFFFTNGYLSLKFENFAVLSKNIRYYFDNKKLYQVDWTKILRIFCEKNFQIKLTPKNFLLIIFNVVYIEVNETRKKL
jgi:hypothetical protein